MEQLLEAAQLFGRNNRSIEKNRLNEDQAFRAEPSIDRSVLGLLIFLGSEVMFFAGLISAFLILRAGSATWPPPDQPRLPSFITGINTGLLLISAFTTYLAMRAIREERQKALITWLGVTGGLGTIFLIVQGSEWMRLVQFGLTVSSSIYGGIFYAIIGSHGLHVLAAVIVLLVVLRRAAQRMYSAEHHTGLELCRIYWFFVVGLWPVLYVLVYMG
jgi:heme/copper-type cytochrome/quinol oxidase subunit 3